MSKLEDRATPEMLQWLEAVGGERPQLAVRPVESSLAAARAAHHEVWHNRARPEDFAFFFHSSNETPASVSSDETAAQRRRRQRLLKVALLQAMVGAINGCPHPNPPPPCGGGQGGGDESSGST